MKKLLRFSLAAAFALALAVPAAAQPYTAIKTGGVIELKDAKADMVVPVVISVGRPWRIQVKGKDLVRPGTSAEAFENAPGLSGIPPLFPFANRLDQTAIYANGKKYNFDVELGNVRGPIPSTGYVGGYKGWELVDSKADATGAWVSCKLDFYKNPAFIKQFPFAHTITLTYKVSNGMLEVRTRLDNLSTDPMPVVIGYHPIYELPEGNRDLWTVSLDAKTHWIEIPERLPTGETQPIESFFGSDRTKIELKKYALIDDVFTDLVRDAQGRATMRLMYNGMEVDEILGPKFKTVLAWSTPLAQGGGGGGGRGGGGAAGGGRAAGAGGPGAPGAAPAAGAQAAPAAAAGAAGGGGRGGGGGGAGRGGGAAPQAYGPYAVDPAQGRRVPDPATPRPEGAPAPTTKGFIAFEPMVAITNALNLAEKGVYKELQTIPPGGTWEESFWVTAKGF